LVERSQVIKMSNKFAGNLQGFSSVCVCVSTFCNHSPLPPNHPAPDKMLNMKRINLVGSEWGKFYKLFLTFHTHNLINRDIRICLFCGVADELKIEFERDDFIVSKA
jgi:hypothetical protein